MLRDQSLPLPLTGANQRQEKDGPLHGSISHELYYTDALMNNDATLLQAFCSGDEAAFALLAERYHHAIRTTCQRQAPLGEVDDCVQAVFLVLARRPAVAARSPALLAWLHKVAHFVCRDARRAATRRHHTVTQAMRPPTTGHQPETAVLEQLDSALLCLEERQRAAVLLHASGSANDDIAQSLGISSGNASKLVQRGLAALRDRLCRSSTPIGAATVLTLFTTKQAAAAVTVPITLSSLSNASINATLLAKGTVMHLTLTATSTWIIAASLAATLCVGGVVAGKVLAQPPVSPPPTSVVVTPEPTPVPILSDPKPVPVLSEWEKELDEKLSQKLVFNFVDTDPTDLFKFLNQVSGINIIIHPNAKAKMKSTQITLTSKDLTARETLNQLMPMLHVRYLIIDHAVFVTRLPEDDQGMFEKTEKFLAEDKVVGSAEQTPRDKENLAQLDQYVTLDFSDSNLVDVVSFFQQTTRVNFILNQYIAARPPSVTMKVEAMKLRFALNHLIRITNLRYQVRDEAVFITTPETQKQEQALQLKPEVAARDVTPHLIKFNAREMLLKNAIKWLSEGSGVPIRVDPKLQKLIEQRISFNFDDSELSKILELIAPTINAEVKKIEEDGGGYLLTPKALATDQEPVVPAAAQ
jgi:RNA polymerase sigma factor (sigma-70 family)